MKKDLGADASDDPATQGTRVAAYWSGGIDSIISACVGVNEGVRAFGMQRQRLRMFLAPLVTAGMLTKNEERLGRSAPKLSMFIRIGKTAEVLRQPAIKEHLEPEISIIYQLCNMHVEIAKDDGTERAGEEIARIVATRPSRAWLIDETKRRKQARTETKPAPTDQPTEPPRVGQTLKELGTAKHRFGLVLITPGSADMAHLRPAYAPGYLASCLPLLPVLDEDGIVVVIAARVSNLPEIFDKLLPICGIDRHLLTLFPRNSVCIDGSDDEVIVVAKRGDVQVVLIADQRSPADAGRIDFTRIAERLRPGEKRRLHIFAEAETDGWISIGRHSTWDKEPSLK